MNNLNLQLFTTFEKMNVKNQLINSEKIANITHQKIINALPHDPLTTREIIIGVNFLLKLFYKNCYRIQFFLLFVP